MNRLNNIKVDVYELYEDGSITEYDKSYLLNLIDEKEVYTERLETNIVDRVGFNKKYDLYHVSNVKIPKTIKANSVNMGTRLSKPRLSSFWTRDKDLSMFWAAFKTISHSSLSKDIMPDIAFNIKRRKLVVYKANFMKLLKPPKKELTSEMTRAMFTALKSKDPVIRGNIDKVAKLVTTEDKVKEALAEVPCYLYTKKDVPIKDIGSGQFRIDEYTLDKDTDFDSVEQIKPNDMLKAIEFITDEIEFRKLRRKDDAKGFKSKNIFTDLLLYGTSDTANIKAKGRKDIYIGLSSYNEEIPDADPHKAFKAANNMRKFIRGREEAYANVYGKEMDDDEFEDLVDKAKEKYIK